MSVSHLVGVAKAALRERLAVVRVPCGSRRFVALTFDDGPEPDSTHRILDALEGSHHRVTFFVEGRKVADGAVALRRAIDLGCEIGNHTWSHRIPNTLSHAEMVDEIERCDAAIAEVTGAAGRPCYRPPLGEVSPGLLVYLWTRRRGRPVLWSKMLGGDRHVDVWSRERCEAEIESTGFEPGDLVLLHDCPSAAATISAVLRRLDAAGCVSVTVSELMRSGRTGGASPGGLTGAATDLGSPGQGA